MKTALIIEAQRTGYSIDQVEKTMTVGQLKAFLEDWDVDDDTPIYLSHDNGYTYGGINMNDFEEREILG